MIADNNLDPFAIDNINQMEMGWNDDFDGNLIVYLDRAEGASIAHPVVYKIVHDTTQNIKSQIIAVYPEQNSADPLVMNNTLSSIIKDYPAQSYGLILWSHGSAWFPKGTELNADSTKLKARIHTITKSFGKDGLDEMSITDLSNSLPLKFQFIIFDACYMGSIEVLYELRNKSDYIISSSTEILSSGYPYTDIMPLLFQQTINYSNLANTFYQSYEKHDGVMKSASVSVANTNNLHNLAQSVSMIMEDTPNLKLADYNYIQQFTLTDNKYLFDLKDFVYSISRNDKLLENFSRNLNNVIVFKASTKKMMDELGISSFSGLSVFIPNPNKNNLYEFYEKLEWFSDSKYDLYFSKFRYNYK